MRTGLKAAGLALALVLTALLVYSNWGMRGVSDVLSRCEKLSLGMNRAQVLAVMGDSARVEKTAILKGQKVGYMVFEVPFTVDPAPQVTFDDATGEAQYIVCSERHRLRK
ncbi:MAG: hypothetical protein HY748_10880 [Elusimicrobia bacterium]|nr:hypothetical protein [Elusimicrobiota bacterium]